MAVHGSRHRLTTTSLAVSLVRSDTRGTSARELGRECIAIRAQQVARTRDPSGFVSS